MEYDIFINYRRVGGKEFARMLALDLKGRGYKVFLDFDELTDGKFDQRIMDAIQSAPIFISILSEGALDRCDNPDDWVRREIEYAVKLGRQIIPINPEHQFKGFSADLPEVLRKGLAHHQISEVEFGQLFEASMNQIVEKRIAKWFAEHPEYAHHGGETSEDKACLKLRTNADCRILIDEEEMVIAFAGRITRLPLASGGYWLQVVPMDTLLRPYEGKVQMEGKDEFLNIEFDLTPRIAENERQRKRKEMEDRKRREEEDERKRKEETKRKRQEEFERQLFQIGENYHLGKNGYKKDLALAVKWYLQAAERGHAGAQYNLSDLYSNGHGVQHDKAKAVEWLCKAAEQGHAEAQFRLGWCYFSGEGVPEDRAKTAEWFRKAAEQGLADAQYFLGICYFIGDGVPQDKVKAVEWYRKAAEQGHAQAQYFLGSCYYNGDGVPKDKVKSAEWWRKAKEAGCF